MANENGPLDPVDDTRRHIFTIGSMTNRRRYGGQRTDGVVEPEGPACKRCAPPKNEPCRCQENRNTALEPELTFKLTYNPSNDRFDAMDVKVGWDSGEVVGPVHRPVVERTRASEHKRFEFEIDPRVESWNEFELFVEVEYWLSGDFTKFEHYWAGDVTITKPADWPE